jgi:hemoglobin-like flavoprotein
MGLNVDLLRASFEKAVPIAGEVADKFYEHLWGDYPQSKALFKGVKMPKQKKALVGSLVFIVDNLENPEKLTEYLESMGGRHVGYGTQPEHYEWVGASLLKTFAFFFGDDWTEELHNAWAQAYGVITQIMLSGAEKVAPITTTVPNTEDILEEARGVASTLINQVMQETIKQELANEELVESIRVEIRKAIYQVFEEETQKLLGKKAA